MNLFKTAFLLDDNDQLQLEDLKCFNFYGGWVMPFILKILILCRVEDV